MRNLPGVAVLLALILTVVTPALAPRAKAQAAPDAGRKPVVVELFTSEGCSSCPPADTLLQELVGRQPIPGTEIIALEEHVDYWNHDGWVDPFSSPEWTLRQQTYVTLIKKDAYTPELVVDGLSQFVGNDARQAQTEIEKAAGVTKTQVAITTAPSDSKGSRFHVSVGKLVGATSGDVAEIWLAVAEDGLHSQVASGENAGHVLQHVATLRSLRKIGVADANGATASFTGDPVMKFNSRWNIEKLHVIVFVQKKKSREILGAASTTIQSMTSDSKPAS